MRYIWRFARGDALARLATWDCMTLCACSIVKGALGAQVGFLLRDDSELVDSERAERHPYFRGNAK